MSKLFVLINKTGEYLQFMEASNHTPNKHYKFCWTSILNQASLITSTDYLKRLAWKGESPIADIVGFIPAIETRTIELINIGKI